jgi:hypothetical protein
MTGRSPKYGSRPLRDGGLRALAVVATIAGVCAVQPASAAQVLVVLDSCTEQSADWLIPLMEAASATPGVTVRYGTNGPWPGKPEPAELAGADSAYQRGLDQFLDADMKGAAGSFGEAFDRYAALLELYPFHVASYEAAVRAGFYQAHTLRLAKDTGGARGAAVRVLASFPSAKPDPGMFPPDFADFVAAVRGSNSVHSLRITVNPPGAHISINGYSTSSAEGAEEDLKLPGGTYRVVVGYPGLGVLRQEVDLQSAATLSMELMAWPATISEAECGAPMGTEALADVAAAVPEASVVVVSTDLKAIIGEEGTGLFVQTLTGELTAFFALPPGVSISGAAAPKLAKVLADASGSEAAEFYRVGDDGRASLDDGLAARVRGGGTPVEEGLVLRVALDLGTGFGVATEVTDPGLAPTPFLIRPDLALAISDHMDLGVAGRFQLPQFAALAEPYARWRFDYLALRAGLAVGNIVHTITVTENRDASRSGTFGLSAGLEVPLGPARLGTTILAPLYPDATVQVDFTVGAGFDLSL